ncbi:MAG: SDR family NAD(P)-dependent oxidoreductase [Kiritimatiellia bacterium]|jgi:sorbitol-6-phosphate 2-dehydrogenase
MLCLALPVLRGLLAESATLPLLALSDAPAPDGAPRFPAVPADAGADALAALWRPAAEAAAGADVVAIDGLGAVTVRCPCACGRAGGKVCVVTGAAQGFGNEIAADLARQGARLVLADINEAGVRAAAEAMNALAGAPVAIGLTVDVANAESMARAVEETVKAYGGIDLLVSNAGVVRSGSVMTLPVKDFDFVTTVNYKGFFVCTQAVAPVMAAQHAACPGRWSDIVQINSKSGLEGSNKNAAYAGSKFGGIGLVQSFALELVAHGIKVNAICPGNFLDGPLWSDPVKGLFVQYFQAGKVPGAKSVEDVRKFYEGKVPMGRGCSTPDVMHALYYLMEQQYETGQAVPVTGGQVMLN